ncbi:unnamed protein product [Prorocentrum cordatum]|uniref:Uncharacterized protein n=1 Tax=Prorocentrum cordatum TaxID=2364126 RepID=A0ABN9X215_9DINO|nr:unnamed protein product [Polarella glacialis]
MRAPLESARKPPADYRQPFTEPASSASASNASQTLERGMAPQDSRQDGAAQKELWAGLGQRCTGSSTSSSSSFSPTRSSTELRNASPQLLASRGRDQGQPRPADGGPGEASSPLPDRLVRHRPAVKKRGQPYDVPTYADLRAPERISSTTNVPKPAGFTCWALRGDPRLTHRQRAGQALLRYFSGCSEFVLGCSPSARWEERKVSR